MPAPAHVAFAEFVYLKSSSNHGLYTTTKAGANMNAAVNMNTSTNTNTNTNTSVIPGHRSGGDER